MLCQAILFNGSNCKHPSKLVTSEGIHACIYHKRFTLSKKEHILKIVEEDEFNKDRKLFINSLNRELLDYHEFDIPLKNKFGLIVDFAFVSKSDFEEVNKYKWSKDYGGYAKKCSYDDTESLMHRYLLGKSDDGFVIDHKDNNRLNNRRENLRFATQSENNQNKAKLSNTSSKYIGVSYDRGKWSAKCSKKHLGLFKKELDAAKTYDTYVLLYLGKDAKTNGLVKYNEITVTLDYFKKNKKRDLPSNINFQRNSLYIISKTYNGINYYKTTRSLEEAEKILKEFNDKISEIKIQEEVDHFAKEIKRNNDGLAIIEIFNKKFKEIQNVIVDDDKWHKLSKCKWTKSGNYYDSVVSSNKV
jgi:hypothetical protein